MVFQDPGDQLFMPTVYDDVALLCRPLFTRHFLEATLSAA
jgi:energy-coupling factor transporter ATP-binding protein EcfA2